ncbi:EF-hand domain-containing protein [Saccharothrix yanglingensis]|uniref:Calcium-binding protein n=1 Tax=Saccharothrix yanglingensis TaxID=659496 RepID=A0ABU0X875_9PSEU|nr:EF-hand domain-containing protein [Saccharothrix yanglingensis]MDQ2588337.1 calcium-binding protein [Saccharothrix yanglingensis]
MQTEAQARVGLVFDLFDVNGNGRIEARDFELMAGRVDAAATGSGDAARARMTAAFRRYWATLAAELDVDGDGAIPLDEFVACVLSPERFADTIAEFAESLAELGDPDGDGRIERPLFVALMTAIGFDPANTNALFDAFGPSEADEVEVRTWTEAIEDYYQPDKAGTTGDLLVAGPTG